KGIGQDKVKGMNTGRFPVESMSWDSAMSFCRLLSGRPDEVAAGRVYRLPTEAEWEYACRGGTAAKTPFHFGQSLASDQANFDGNRPYRGIGPGPWLERTTTVGSYPPNGFGLYDMHGNVAEWCSDWYDKNYYSTSPKTDPKGAASGKYRIIRG